MLEAFALHAYQRRSQGTGLAALLHQGEHVAAAQQQLRELLAGLLAEAAEAGDVRDDTPPGELASYCLHALTAADSLGHNAIHRLVTLWVRVRV